MGPKSHVVLNTQEYTSYVPLHFLICDLGIQNSNSPISSIFSFKFLLNSQFHLWSLVFFIPMYFAHVGPIPEALDIQSVRSLPQQRQQPTSVNVIFPFTLTAFGVRALISEIVTVIGVILPKS